MGLNSNEMSETFTVQLPELPNEYLDIQFVDDLENGQNDFEQIYPFAVSQPTEEVILHASKLTEHEDVKEVYLLELSTKLKYEPGDTIGIVPENLSEDVKKLFAQLKISKLSFKPCVIKKKENIKKNLAMQNFIGRITTLQYIFTHLIDFRCLPKKLLIRILAEYTTESKEKRNLQILCSKEGSEEYIRQILNTNTTLLDLLVSHPSCCPPVARLLEHLPKLLPRPYSIASSMLTSPEKLKIVFSVIKFNNKYSTEGLCSGLLKKLANKAQEGEACNVKMFLRKNQGFSLPQDMNIPIIMVGPGTGIAPFLGFLEHLKQIQWKGKTILFFGCRHKDKDFLFRDELNGYLKAGVLSKLFVAFSREEGSHAKYVQDSIRENSRELSDLIFEENAKVYVCGDAKNMKKDISQAFVDVISITKGVEETEAISILKKLQTNKQYIEDIWI